MSKFDVICIGGGHASWPIAVELQKKGKKTLLIANDRLGGTCTSWGCDPKILLDAPFEIMSEAERYRDIGLEGSLTLRWEKLQAYNREVISPLPKVVQSNVEAAGVTLIFGNATMRGPNTVSVNGQDYTADKIVIATGQRAATPDIPGAEHIKNSSDFLYMEHMPERLVFIGAGIISLEFASMAVKLAKKVTIIQNSDRALPQYYERYSQKIVDHLAAQGVEFLFNNSVTKIDLLGDVYRVETATGEVIETDYILGASGRIPNVEGLGLEKAGVEFTQRGIITDDHLRTTAPHIYASGDIRDTVLPRLTPTAFFEAAYIARHILGDETPIHYPVIPNVVFTIPRIAQVGVSQQEARASDNYKVIDIEYGKQMLFQTRHEREAELCLVLDRDGYLVGADIYGDFGAELINFLTLIITHRFTAADLKKMIFAFPAHSFTIAKFVLESIIRPE